MISLQSSAGDVHIVWAIERPTFKSAWKYFPRDFKDFLRAHYVERRKSVDALYFEYYDNGTRYKIFDGEKHILELDSVLESLGIGCAYAWVGELGYRRETWGDVDKFGLDIECKAVITYSY